MYKIFLLLSLFSSLAFGADHLLYAPSGNLILDAKVGSVVKVNKTLRVDNITNLAGTSGAPGMVPIGGMVAVMPNTHANAWQPPATGVIKDGFMRADGAVVPTCADCVIPAGTTMPNMVSRFPKGSTTSGTTAGSATKNLPGHYHGFGSGSSMTATLGATNVSLASGVANTDGSHNHTIGMRDDGGLTSANIQFGSTGNTFAFHSSGVFGAQTGGGGDGKSYLGGSHNHSVSGTTNIAHSHTITGNIGLVTGGCDGNSGASCSINVEPAYMETVWIIRVK